MSRSQPWRARAACAETACDDWFPEPRARVNPMVLRVCAGCPVWRNCLLFVLVRPDIFHGVWAGLTVAEIATLRERLICGELGADIIDLARRITENRAGQAVHASAAPDPLPGHRPIRRQRRQVEARLRAVGLLDDNRHRGRAA